MSQVYSIGAICKATGQPLHRVRYALESRGIAPVGRIDDDRAPRLGPEIDSHDIAGHGLASFLMRPVRGPVSAPVRWTRG